MSYDKENIFAKILRGEIPCDKIYEDEYVLSFKDIRPQAPSHALVIPKGEYIDINDFSANASDEEIVGFNRAISNVADMLGISEKSGGGDIGSLQMLVRMRIRKYLTYTFIYSREDHWDQWYFLKNLNTNNQYE